MTSTILTTEWVVRTTPLSVAPPLSAKLREIHRQWMDESSEWLRPTLAPDANFWNGWSAVRYLNDQFDRQYRRKCALVAAWFAEIERVTGELRLHELPLDGRRAFAQLRFAAAARQ